MLGKALRTQAEFTIVTEVSTFIVSGLKDVNHFLSLQLGKKFIKSLLELREIWEVST